MSLVLQAGWGRHQYSQCHPVTAKRGRNQAQLVVAKYSGEQEHSLCTEEADGHIIPFGYVID